MSRHDNLTCDEVEPLLAALALGEPDQPERTLVEQHLAGCPRCRVTLTAYQNLSSLLPLAAAEAVPSPNLRARVVSAVRAAAEPRPPDVRANTPWPAPIWRRPIAAFAALALAALLAWNISLQARLAAEQAARARQEADLAALVQSPALIRLPLAATDIAPGAVGSLLLDRAGHTAVLSVAGMPALPPGRVYQLWMVHEAQGRLDCGTFTVDKAGAATLVVTTPAPVGDYRAVGVTIEPTGGSPGPTSPRVIGAPLS